MTARQQAIFYVILIVAIAIIWAGLRTLPRWILLVTFAAAFVAAGAILVDAWRRVLGGAPRQGMGDDVDS